MNLRDIWETLDRERRSQTLQPIDDQFNRQIKDYVQELKEERARSNGDMARILDTDMRNIKLAFDQIHEIRVGKVIKLARLAMHDADVKLDNLTKDELELFERLSNLLKSYRRKTIEPVFPETQKNSYTIVRILKNIPSFVGFDGRNYTLKEEDIVTLPEDDAEALSKKKFAVPIK